MWQVPLGAAIIAFMGCLGLRWLPLAEQISEKRNRSIQFGTRTILLLTVVVAIDGAVGLRWKSLGGILLACCAFGFAIYTAIHNRPARIAILTLIACMFLPFNWLFTSGMSSNFSFESISSIGLLPALFPTLLLGAAIGTHPENLTWVAFLLAAVEVVAGVWVSRINLKLAICYCVAATLVSLMGSLILHALLRA